MGHKGLPPNAIALGLLLSHEQGSEPLDTRELTRWFLDSHHGAPGFIGSADTLPALRVALDLAELSPTRINRVRPYPELSIAPEKLQFAHLSAIYKVLSDAQIANKFLQFALAVTDNKTCLEQVWKWIGHVPQARSTPVFSPGSLITITFFPEHPRPHHAFQRLAYHYPLQQFATEPSPAPA